MTTLKITDGDWEVNFTNGDSGWILLGMQGWGPRTADLKGGGFFTQSTMAHGDQLRHAAFDNVSEAWQCKLGFQDADLMLNQIDMLEELLMVRAPRYWTDRRCHSPVWIERQMNGETGTAYALVNYGKLTLPDVTWDQCTLDNGMLDPVLVTISRQPFWTGAAPGEAQKSAELTARQDWKYNLLWEQETNLPSGYIYCFVEDHDGIIWAGGASQILYWWGGAWNVAGTAPVVLTSSVTGAVLLPNGDILFGGSGRIIKRSAAGAWSVDTTDPVGQVWDLILADSGEVYAADVSRIWVRSTAGVWSLDSTLPAGQVYSFCQASSGKLLAGAVGEILRQTDPPTSTELSVRLSAAGDNAEQYNSAVYVPPTGYDLDLFNYNYVAMRFALDVPAGATINSAKLRVMLRSPDSVNGDSLAAKIHCEYCDDSAAFTDDDNLSNRQLTPRYVAWQDTTKRRRSRFFYSPDFGRVLQQVVDRGGWATGQHVSVFVRCDDLNYVSDHASRRQIWDWRG